MIIKKTIKKALSNALNNIKTKKKLRESEKITVWLKKGYPYAKYFIDPKNLINTIRKYKPIINYEKYSYLYKKQVPNLKDHRFNGKYISIYIPLKDYNTLDIIVDYYTEQSRLKCTLKNKISAYDLATKHNLLSYTLKNMVSKNIPLTYESIRDEIYNYPNIYICSGESVLFYKGLLNILFNSENYSSSYPDYTKLNIMDGAIGYGQRLMIAMVLKCNYIGIDPNVETIAGCKQMIKDLGTRNKLQRAYPEGLPSSPHINRINPATQDVVFFSPPSFDEEIYSTDEQQSILLFPTFDSWLKGFLQPSLDILVSKVKHNGYLIIQSRQIKHIYQYLINKNNIKFMGIIARKTYGGKYKPNHIFKKA